jgi:3-methyladenine DNA glycosylase AlkD
MDNVIERLRQELHDNADERKRASGERFFKEDVKLYGLTVPTVNRMAKSYVRELKGRSKQDIFTLCDELWKSNYMEEAIIACIWSHSVNKAYEPEDIEVFERWVDNYVTNWATCDTLCNHTVGDLIDMYPQLVEKLKTWAKSDNRWMRRAAAVSLIVPARRGRFLSDVFQIADLLLLDTDDLVRKGYGWMLKAASEAHQQEVFSYVMKHRDEMPRTSLRYAIEKMPPNLKAQAMAK